MSQPLQLLFVVPYVPNKVRVRPYQWLRHLARRGHAITLLTVTNSPADLADIAALEAEGIRVEGFRLPTWRSGVNCLAGLPTPDPLQSFYCWQPQLSRRLIALAEQDIFDAVHVEHMRGTRFGQALAAAQKGPGRRVPIVWDSVDCISHLFQQSSQHSQKQLSRWITRFELGRSRGYEGRMLTEFQRTLVTSPRDREALLALLPDGAKPPCIDVLPNGVDLDYFTPAPLEARAANQLVVSGKMSYHANVSMTLYLVREIMPLVWSERPETRLVVAGKDPPDSIRRLASDPRIRVTGTVPDLRPELRSAALAVAPLTYGAGIQNKVLEAMACGTPVVATPLAVSALLAQPGQDLLTGANPQEFARSMLRLLSDPEERERVGRAGRKYVEVYHDWRQAAARLEDIYRQETS